MSAWANTGFPARGDRGASVCRRQSAGDRGEGRLESGARRARSAARPDKSGSGHIRRDTDGTVGRMAPGTASECSAVRYQVEVSSGFGRYPAHQLPGKLDRAVLPRLARNSVAWVQSGRAASRSRGLVGYRRAVSGLGALRGEPKRGVMSAGAVIGAV